MEKFSHLATKTKSEKEGILDDVKSNHQPSGQCSHYIGVHQKQDFIVKIHCEHSVAEKNSCNSRQAYLQECLLMLI